MHLEKARQEIVAASHILSSEGVFDAYGHVSRRHPERSDRYLISCAKAPALIGAADVLELDLTGSSTSEPDAGLFLERFIHSEIYRQRPDVQAVVHSHALSVLPFSVVDAVPIRPLSHMCGFLYGTPTPFDLADHAGPGSDLLIRSAPLGAALAKHLGNCAVVLMRGHGYTVVGEGIPQVTFRAIYTARHCEAHLAALRLGEPAYLSASEALACDQVTSGQIHRSWDLWQRRHVAVHLAAAELS